MTDIIDTDLEKGAVTVDETELDLDTEENDPMLAGLREAEEEIAKQKAETEGDEGDKGQETDEGDADAGDGPKGNKKPVMIPIERLNAALSERDALRDIISHQKGIIEVQTQALSSGKADKTENPNGKVDDVAKPETDLKTIISDAESKKIELAQKYEDGELSYSEMVRESTKLDAQIREHELSLYSKVEENAKKAATDIVSSNNVKQIINQEAIKIQAEHPYVAEIDKLPEHLAQGIWNQISQEAVQSLMSKGINPMDGTVQSRVALMKEKALLTDKYGPQFTGKTFDKNQPSNQISEKAKQRAEKIDLADNQPPRLGANVGGDTRDLTEADLMSMNEDQIADFLSKAPELVHKAAGLRKR